MSAAKPSLIVAVRAGSRSSIHWMGSPPCLRWPSARIPAAGSTARTWKPFVVNQAASRPEPAPRSITSPGGSGRTPELHSKTSAASTLSYLSACDAAF